MYEGNKKCPLVYWNITLRHGRIGFPLIFVMLRWVNELTALKCLKCLPGDYIFMLIIKSFFFLFFCRCIHLLENVYALGSHYFLLKHSSYPNCSTLVCNVRSNSFTKIHRTAHVFNRVESKLRGLGRAVMRIPWNVHTMPQRYAARTIVQTIRGSQLCASMVHLLA